MSPFTAFSGVGIYKRDLLNARVIVHTYNPHIGSFLPSLGSLTTKVYSVVEGADIVMKSSGFLICPEPEAVKES
jgi:hypothetical protein